MNEHVRFATTVFGGNIRRLRVKEGITQVQLADMLGVQQSMISNLEAGERRPSIELAFAISRVFDVPLDELNNPSSLIVARRLGVTTSELNDMNQSNLVFPVELSADYESDAA